MMEIIAKKHERKLTRIGVVSTGVTLAALYAIIGIIYALIYAAILAFFGALISSKSASPAGVAIMGVGAIFIVVVFPIFFAVAGFIGGALMALVYNFVAKYTGGISFEVSG
jgi:hypothetical protein